MFIIIIVRKILLNGASVLFTDTSNLSIFFTQTKFSDWTNFSANFTPKNFQKRFYQKIVNPVQGKVKGQVDAAPVHIKQPHKPLRHARQLSFDEVFYNIHVLEINSYITSSVFLTNTKSVLWAETIKTYIAPAQQLKLSYGELNFKQNKTKLSLNSWWPTWVQRTGNWSTVSRLTSKKTYWAWYPKKYDNRQSPDQRDTKV